MNRNYRFGNVNEALPVLMGDLLTYGDEVGSRTGRTLELTHVGISLTEPWKREIVLPERKASIAAQIAETMWVLSGRDDVEWLARYLPRAVDFSDDGKTWRAGYGQRLRNYHGVDQIDYIVDTLRASSSSRQAVAIIWDPPVDTQPGKDIACNNWLNFSSRLGKLDLHVAIRSNDSMWGWSGINAFEWSALQEIVAGMLGLDVGSLHFSVTSFHLYEIHMEKARRISAQDGNFMYSDSPRFNATGVDDMKAFDYLANQWFGIEQLIREGYRTEDMVEEFPETMLQSWLRVLQWWWSGDTGYIDTLRHTRLYEACKVGMQPGAAKLAQANAPGGLVLGPQPTYLPEPGSLAAAQADDKLSFVQFVDDLHTAKHAAYGDSWKRRGEYMIMSNIARKIDRLEGGLDTSDETQTDTAVDLLVYLCKYDSWLNDGPGDPNSVRNRLLSLEAWHETASHPHIDAGQLVELFSLFEKLKEPDEKRYAVGVMMEGAYCLAWSRWSS